MDEVAQQELDELMPALNKLIRLLIVQVKLRSPMNYLDRKRL